MHHLDYYQHYVRVRHEEQLAAASRRRLVVDRPRRVRQLREWAARSLVRLARRLSDDPVVVERSAAQRVVDVSDASTAAEVVDVSDRPSQEPVGAAAQRE